jgi:site-specific DNA-methyltransferase (adenine-specific)
MRPYYQDDLVTIYHGDCRDVAPLVTPDLVLADPPYGVSARTDNATQQRGGLTASRDYAPVHGDDQPFNPAPFLGYPNVVLWGANHYADRLPTSPAWFVWDKLAGLTSKRDAGFNDNAECELAWTNLDGTARIFSHRWLGMLKASERNISRVHPTQKPVALMSWCLSFFPDARLVFDPFMGSGPVPRACKDRGVRCVAAELVEEYCERAAERCRQEVLALGVA